jgi:hypothetical protein
MSNVTRDQLNSILNEAFGDEDESGNPVDGFNPDVKLVDLEEAKAENLMKRFLNVTKKFKTTHQFMGGQEGSIDGRLMKLYGFYVNIDTEDMQSDRRVIIMKQLAQHLHKQLSGDLDEREEEDAMRMKRVNYLITNATFGDMIFDVLISDKLDEIEIRVKAIRKNI